MKLKITHVMLAGSLLVASSAFAEEYPGVALPCKDVTIKFLRPGRINDIPVKESQKIKKGDVLAKLDDSEERQSYEQDKARAEDETKVNAQLAIRNHEEAKLNKMKYGKENGAVSSFELEEAKLSVLVEGAKVDLTNFEHKMEKIKAQQSKIVLDKMVIVSPMDGQIETQFAKSGESVEPSTNVVRVIDLSSLHIESPVPFAAANKLKEKDKAVVRFSDKSTAEGEVIFIAGMADAASGTLLVRVEVKNAENRRAGDRVKLEFPVLDVKGK